MWRPNATNRPRNVDWNKKPKKNFHIGQQQRIKQNQNKSKQGRKNLKQPHHNYWIIESPVNYRRYIAWFGYSPRNPFKIFFSFSPFVAILHLVVVWRVRHTASVDSRYTRHRAAIEVSALRHSSSLSRVVCMRNQLISHLDLKYLISFCCCI